MLGEEFVRSLRLLAGQLGFSGGTTVYPRRRDIVLRMIGEGESWNTVDTARWLGFRLPDEFRIVLTRDGLGTFHPGSGTGRDLCERASRSTLG